MHVEVSRDVLFVFPVLERDTHIPEVPGAQGVFEGLQSNPICQVKRKQENVIGAKCHNKTGGLGGKKKETALYNAQHYCNPRATL